MLDVNYITSIQICISTDSDTVAVCFSPVSLYVPGQLLQQSLQLVAYQFDQSTFNVVIGNVNHEDVGRWIRRLVVLWKKATHLTHEFATVN